MDKHKRLLAELKKHLTANEIIAHVGIGSFKIQTEGSKKFQLGVGAATNKRIIVYTKKLGGFGLLDFIYDDITSIETGKNILGPYVIIYASGVSVRMKWFEKNTTEAFVTHIKKKAAL